MGISCIDTPLVVALWVIRASKTAPSISRGTRATQASAVNDPLNNAHNSRGASASFQIVTQGGFILTWALDSGSYGRNSHACELRRWRWQTKSANSQGSKSNERIAAIVQLLPDWNQMHGNAKQRRMLIGHVLRECLTVFACRQGLLRLKRESAPIDSPLSNNRAICKIWWCAGSQRRPSLPRRGRIARRHRCTTASLP